MAVKVIKCLKAQITLEIVSFGICNCRHINQCMTCISCEWWVMQWLTCLQMPKLTINIILWHFVLNVDCYALAITRRW